jgi:hypothetical protein
MGHYRFMPAALQWSPPRMLECESLGGGEIRIPKRRTLRV